MKHEFPITGPVEAYVELRSGDLTVAAGPPATDTHTDSVSVEVTGSRADSVTVEAQGDRVTIVEPQRTGFLSGRGDLHVAVTLPAGSSLTTKVGAASIRVTGEMGEVQIKSGSGDVSLGTVTGPALVKAGSGDITVESLGAASEIKAGSGTISVNRISGPSQLTTGSGSIKVSEAAAPVALKSGSGDLSVGVATCDASLSAASGDLRVGRITGGQARLKNVSGDIRLGIPEGTPVWTDISTTTGRVRSTLTPTGAPTNGQSHVEVRASSVTGDIHLEQL
jgi:DUF4097 and DUF4098 domain-containing protein YvlB